MSCGERLSRDRLGVASAGLMRKTLRIRSVPPLATRSSGFAVCTECLHQMVALSAGSLPLMRPAARPSWGIAQVDPELMEHLSDAELLHEMEIVRELIAPFVALLEAGERKLAGHPDWRPTHADLHTHRQTVELPDGTVVHVASFIGNEAHRRDSTPDSGLYLDACWTPPWPYELLDWPDFGVPADPVAFRLSCDEVLRRARAGEVIEIGCVGGHGRTGTMLGVVAILCGEPSRSAVDWVRTNYCGHAIETREQEQFVLRFVP